MKTKHWSLIGVLVVFAGAMMGDSQKVLPCLTLLAIGSIIIVIATIKENKNESKEEA